MLNYSKLPEHCRGGVKRYIEEGYLPGGFVTGIFSNDLFKAATHADGINKNLLYEWSMWVLNEAPASCIGSFEIVKQWCKDGGLRGMGYDDKKIEALREV